MAFGIRKYAVRTQLRDASKSAPRRVSLVEQRKIGVGIKAPTSAKGIQDRYKKMLKSAKLKKGLGH